MLKLPDSPCESSRTVAGCKIIAIGVLLVLGATGTNFGHEVDQYDLPESDHFEDLGYYWNDLLYDAVRESVDSLNREIEVAESIPTPVVRDLMLARLHSPDTVARRVHKQLPNVLMSIEGFEWKMRLGILPRRQEGRLLGHRSSMFDSSFTNGSLFPDPRQLNRMQFLRASLLKVHGQHIGTDKIGHFISHGYLYYRIYRTFCLAGDCHEDAAKKTIFVGKYGPISEHFLVGMIPTGIYSNGDMAANYLGMKLFISLTEPVMLQGCQYPSMLVRDGNSWKLRPHVTPEGDYFAAFISEHLDEALNPSIIEPMARGRWQEGIRERAPRLLAWYAGDDPARLNPRYFDEIYRRCTHYYGEDYGHSGNDDQLLTLGDLCFDDDGQPSREFDGTSADVVPASSQIQNQVDVDVFAPEVHHFDHSEIYSIAVQNSSEITMEGVTLMLRVPEGLQVTVLDRPAKFDRVTNSLTWRIGEIESGAEQEFNFTAKALNVANCRWEYTVMEGIRRIRNGAFQTIVGRKSDEVDKVQLRSTSVKNASKPTSSSTTPTITTTTRVLSSSCTISSCSMPSPKSKPHSMQLREN